MKERPILFSAPMVRAILAGQKTQTRRIMKPQPVGVAGKVWPDEDRWGWACNTVQSMVTMEEACSLGPFNRGRRLWVKETWAVQKITSEFLYGPLAKLGLRGYGGAPMTRDNLRVHDTDALIAYRAHPTSYEELQRSPGYTTYRREEPATWRPSIFMPRWASRITLEIADVRVERVQDISEADAIAEGVHDCDHGHRRDCGCASCVEDGCLGAVLTFANLWESINRDRARWMSNPWVWVVEFTRVVRHDEKEG